jgi:hypothetical protein
VKDNPNGLNSPLVVQELYNLIFYQIRFPTITIGLYLILQEIQRVVQLREIQSRVIGVGVKGLQALVVVPHQSQVSQQVVLVVLVGLLLGALLH